MNIRTKNRFHQISLVLLERILSFIPACFNNTARYNMLLFCCMRSELRKSCPYSEFFWFAFLRIPTEYEDFHSKSPYSVQACPNVGKCGPESSKYGHLSRSGWRICNQSWVLESKSNVQGSAPSRQKEKTKMLLPRHFI